MNVCKCTRCMFHVFQGCVAYGANQVPGEIHLSETVQTVTSTVNKVKDSKNGERANLCAWL